MGENQGLSRSASVVDDFHQAGMLLFFPAFCATVCVRSRRISCASRQLVIFFSTNWALYAVLCRRPASDVCKKYKEVGK